jgi:hypothetical protein
MAVQQRQSTIRSHVPRPIYGKELAHLLLKQGFELTKPSRLPVNGSGVTIMDLRHM